MLQMGERRHVATAHFIDMDLSRVPESERAAVWTQWSAETFRNSTISGCPGGTVDGFIRGVRLGDGRLLKIRSAGRRLVSQPVASGDLALTIVVQLTGVSRFDQGARSCRLAPGDIGVIDGLFPFQQQVSYASDMILLQIGRGTAAARYPALLHCSARAYPALEPCAALVRGAVESAFAAAAELSVAQRERLCRALFDLAALLSGEGRELVVAERNEPQIALDEIEARLGDSTFNAPALATLIGLSRRRLDGIFMQQLGRPITAYIWERRLERARDLLTARDHHARSVTEIAFAVGFKDLSHFSRAYKSRFGAAPSIWRAQALAPRGSGLLAPGTNVVEPRLASASPRV